MNREELVKIGCYEYEISETEWTYAFECKKLDRVFYINKDNKMFKFMKVISSDRALMDSRFYKQFRSIIATLEKYTINM